MKKLLLTSFLVLWTLVFIHCGSAENTPNNKNQFSINDVNEEIKEIKTSYINYMTDTDPYVTLTFTMNTGDTNQYRFLSVNIPFKQLKTGNYAVNSFEWLFHYDSGYKSNVQGEIQGNISITNIDLELDGLENKCIDSNYPISIGSITGSIKIEGEYKNQYIVTTDLVPTVDTTIALESNFDTEIEYSNCWVDYLY